MRWKVDSLLAASAMLLVVGLRAAAAQQVTVATPQTTVSDSFFEHMGSSWGLRGKNWFFQFGPPGNPNGAAPPFGGFDPSAGANFGVGFGGAGFNGGLLGNFSQGSRRTFTSTTPMVTVQNGVPGYVADASVSPFVMGYVPIVGGFPTLGAFQPAMPQPSVVTGHPAVVEALQRVPDNTPIAPKPDVVGANVPDAPIGGSPEPGGGSAAGSGRSARLPDDPFFGRAAASAASSAAQPAMSVAAAQRLREQEAADGDSQARQFIERGRQAERDGKPRLARTYYQMAVRRASGVLRDEAIAHLSALPPTSDTAK